MHLKGRSIIYSSMQHLVDKSRDAQYALNYLSVEVRCVRESADIKQCWNKKKVLQRCSRVFQADKCREGEKRHPFSDICLYADIWLSFGRE